jgi:hypothetical protein
LEGSAVNKNGTEVTPIPMAMRHLRCRGVVITTYGQQSGYTRYDQYRFHHKWRNHKRAIRLIWMRRVLSILWDISERWNHT